MPVPPISPRSPEQAGPALLARSRAKASRAPKTAAAGDAIEALGGRRSALVSALLDRVPAADRPAAKTAIPAILEAARSGGISDPNRIGYFLATAQTESDFGAHMTEAGHSPAWFNATYGNEDGNRAGTGDGYAYRGRGYVQITHAGRYAQVSRALGLPDVAIADRGGVAGAASGRAKTEPALVAHPEKLAEPKLAARALVVGIFKNLFTGNPAAALDATIPVGKQPGQVDFYHARGIVNAIVADQATAIAEHATTYARVLDGYRHSVLGAPPAK
jgi:predicted chitinase